MISGYLNTYLLETYYQENKDLKITLVLIISMTLSYFLYTFIEVYASNLRKKIRYSLK